MFGQLISVFPVKTDGCAPRAGSISIQISVFDVEAVGWMRTQATCWISHLCFAGPSSMLSSTHIFISPTAGHNPSSRHGICLPPLSAPVYLPPFILTHAILLDFHAFQTCVHICGITTCTLRAAWDYVEPRWDEELPQEPCSINNLLGVIPDRRGRWEDGQRQGRSRHRVMDGYFTADISPAVLVSVFCEFSQSLHSHACCGEESSSVCAHFLLVLILYNIPHSSNGPVKSC